MRVNARLDDTTQQQLDYLTQATGESVSHVLRESVAQYYAQVVQARRKPSKILAMAGSWSSGRADTSSDVKAAYLEALRAKYPQHFGHQASAEPPGQPPSAKAKPAAKTKLIKG